MKFIAVICLSFLNFNGVVAINLSQIELSPECPKHVINLTEVDYSFGFMDPFYSFVQHIYHNMQSTTNDSYQKKLNIILPSNGHFNTDNIYYFLLKQPWIMVVLISCIVYVVILPTCGILFFCDLCFCATADSVSSSEALEITQKNKLSKYLFCLNLIMMTIMLVIIVMLMIIYIKSVSHTVIKSNRIQQSIDTIYADANLLIIASSSDLTCKINKTLRKVCARINNTVQEMPNRIIRAFQEDPSIASLSTIIKKFEIENVTQQFNDVMLAITSAKSLANGLTKAIHQQRSVQDMIDTFEQTEYQLTALLQQYNNILKEANNMRENVELLLDGIIKTVNLTLDQTNRFLRKISEKTNLIIVRMNRIIHNLNFIVQQGYHKINNFMKTTFRNAGFQLLAISVLLLAIIPVLLLIIPSINVVAYGIYLLARNDRYRPEQQGYWRCAGLLSLFIAGVVFFTGWITMLIASIAFMGSFGVETICQQFFRDQQMDLYRSSYFNSAITKLIHFSQPTLAIGEFFYHCKYHKSILSALKMGSFLRSYEQIYAKYLSDAAQNAERLVKGQNFNLTFSDIQLRKFNSTAKKLTELKENLFNYVIPPSITPYDQYLSPSVEGVKRRMSDILEVIAEMEKNLAEVMNYSLNSQNFTLLAQKIIAREYNLTISDISRRVMRAKLYLLNRSFICRPFYDILVNVGTVLCEQFCRPIHGIWSSASIIAICLVAIVVIVLCISAFFFSLNNNFERRTRKAIIST